MRRGRQLATGLSCEVGQDGLSKHFVGDLLIQQLVKRLFVRSVLDEVLEPRQIFAMRGE